MLSPPLRMHFQTYAEYHRHPTNVLCHKIGIPLIVFHVAGMLAWVKLGAGISLATVAIALVSWWYARIGVSAKLFLLTLLFYALCLGVSLFVSWPWIVAAAVIGWTVQLLGHAVWEKRSPAFLTNLLQALIGPLYFVALLTGDWPERAAEPPAR